MFAFRLVSRRWRMRQSAARAWCLWNCWRPTTWTSVRTAGRSTASEGSCSRSRNSRRCERSWPISHVFLLKIPKSTNSIFVYHIMHNASRRSSSTCSIIECLGNHLLIMKLPNDLFYPSANVRICFYYLVHSIAENKWWNVLTTHKVRGWLRVFSYPVVHVIWGTTNEKVCIQMNSANAPHITVWELNLFS